ncbi:oligopeptide:H+ symporter [Brevundimonas sp.]|uniref:peptide MFS transporter n=1 Tax=Brevundimonas sp. TaxID=1871086 RepID=UPI002D69F579|nr:oligopeptide:H+ symporter [Brevundimonas sp.]HYD28175.1 oligopeptide:H+ symporter [Brevundimonas sp.]
MNLVILLGVVVTLVTGIPVLLQILKNHPKGLITCFFAEMWERFSFYGMRGLLIFYLTQHFLFDDRFASGQYGTYGSLVYLLPLIGGIVADRYIGTRKAIMFGAVLLVMGHGLMAFEGRAATQTLVYGDQTYQVQIEGRGDNRQTRLLVDGQPYAFSQREASGLQIEGAPGLPATLAEDTYQITDPVEVDKPAWAVLGDLVEVERTVTTEQTLTYNGQTYPVRNVTEDGETRTTIQVAGRDYPMPTTAGLNIEGLPATASLPASLDQEDFSFEEQRDPLGLNVFWLALSLIIMGVGFLKPNISTLVGQLYPQGDPRRDSGFTLYYYGINLGSFWAAVLCGFLGQTYGWGWGFGLAGVGMLAGLIVFVLGKKLLQGKGESPYPELIRKPVLGPINREWLIYILAFVGVGLLATFIVSNHMFVGIGLVISTLLSLGFITWFIITKCDKVARERMMLAMVLVFGSAVFFTLFEQAGSSLNLFADRNVDLAVTSQAYTLFGMPVGSPDQLAAAGLDTSNWWGWINTSLTASQTQSFNAGFILIFAPVFAALWAFLASRRVDPNPVVKFGLGIIQVGLGFLVIVWGVKSGMVDEAFQTPLMLLALLYLLHTTGELFLSPVGLSEITKLSVPSIVSFMMAVWFMASSIAHFLGGIIAATAGTNTVGGEVTDPQAALQSSLSTFNSIGWVGVGIGVAFILASFFIAKWSNGVNDPDNHPGPTLTDRGGEDGNVARPGTSTLG